MKLYVHLMSVLLCRMYHNLLQLVYWLPFFLRLSIKLPALQALNRLIASEYGVNFTEILIRRLW